MSFQAAGSIEDFDAAAQAVKLNLASLARVMADQVNISVVPASITVNGIIQTASSTANDEVAAHLSSALSSSSDASTALGITVLSTPEVKLMPAILAIIIAPSPPPPSPPPGKCLFDTPAMECIELWHVIVVLVGLVALGSICVLAGILSRRRAQMVGVTKQTAMSSEARRQKSKAKSNRKCGSERPSHEHANQELPEGWQEFVDDDGSKYYFNELSQTTSWSKPLKAASAGASKELPEGWEEVEQDGDVYYYNSKTRTTSWTKPTTESTHGRASTCHTPSTRPLSHANV